MKRLFTTWLSVLIPVLSFSQEGVLKTLELRETYFKLVEVEVKKNILYTNLNPGFNYTSLSIELPKSSDISRSYIFLGESAKLAIHAYHDDNDPENNEIQETGLMIAPKPSRYFSFFSGNIEGKIRFKLLYAEPIKIEKDKKKELTVSNCEKPESIDQEVWRKGLPDPTVEPTPTIVNHIILHHSASSNTDTDYVNTVRNIYLYHTQSRGYDDIAYNYLVAPDGTLFDGRDGKQYGDDNVKGAHFCSKNSGTMGVCLLGNYQDTLVSDQALIAIENLLAWKLYKENLNPSDSFWHPENDSSAIYLGTISAHRNGCSTECPGINYYNMKEFIKEEVDLILKGCAPAVVKNTKSQPAIVVYPNPSTYNFIWIAPLPIKGNLTIKLTDTRGTEVWNNHFENTENELKLNFENLPKGIYFLRITNAHISMSEKIVLM